MALKVSNFRLGIGIPASLSNIPIAFFDSFIQLERPDFVYLPAKNGPIDQLRNTIVEQAFVNGCSHVIMMDTDQVYPVNTITKLLSHNVPFVAGQIFRRYPPFDNLLYKGEVNHYTSMVPGVDYQDGDLVEVSAVGTGCNLISMNVFYKIKSPWYEFLPNKDSERGGVIGEDIGFCLKLKKAGYKIMVDTSVKIGHLAIFNIDESFSQLYQSLTKRQIALNKEKGMDD